MTQEEETKGLSWHPPPARCGGSYLQSNTLKAETGTYIQFPEHTSWDSQLSLRSMQEDLTLLSSEDTAHMYYINIRAGKTSTHIKINQNKN